MMSVVMVDALVRGCGLECWYPFSSKFDLDPAGVKGTEYNRHSSCKTLHLLSSVKDYGEGSTSIKLVTP